MDNLKSLKSFVIILIVFASFICFSGEIYNYDYFSQNDDEGMHYILKIEKLDDLLWKNTSPVLKYNLDQYNNDMEAIYEYNFMGIEANGWLVTKFNEAKKQGLFELFNQAFNAKKQTPFDIYEYRPGYNKFVRSLSSVTDLYIYIILKNAEQKKWDLVAKDLNNWLHTMVVLCENQPFRGRVLITMFALLQKYDLPIETLKEIITMNELVLDHPLKNDDKGKPTPKQKINNLCILNITIANLLLHEKENSALPDKLSQLKYLNPLLTKQTKKINYTKNGLNWTLHSESQVVNKGKLVLPINEVLNGMI